MASFLGLGASADDYNEYHDNDDDDDDNDDDKSSVIHQDSDDDEPIHDDDVDIGFRRHQYETAGSSRTRSRRSRQQAKDDAIYGIFQEPEHYRRTKTLDGPDGPPVFVAATRIEEDNPPAPDPAAPPAFVKSKTLLSEEIQDPLSDEKNGTLESNNDETLEEKEIKQKQKAADEYFQSLLLQAQTRKKRRNEETQQNTSSGGSMTMHFERPQDSQPLKKKDPTVATWEKHEKGIGSKLLFKMGWKGTGGLGSNRRKFQSTSATQITDTSDHLSKGTGVTMEPKVKKGISRPVEVVVRPANLGLGFGNFKEMSKLKTNLQIEAEVRGIELPKSNKKRGVLDIMDIESDDQDVTDNHDNLGTSTRTASSAMPTTQQLMTQKAWKRRKTRRQPPKIIPYQELVAQHEQQYAGGPVIIDMRGPSTADAGTGAANDGTVPLGEELLHNVTFMLNTHENQLHSYSQIVKSTERKEVSLQSEIADLQRQQIEAKDRIKKLENAMTVVQKIENLAQQQQQQEQAFNRTKTIDQAIQWIQELGESFTPEDRVTLKFWQTLAPTLLGPILEVKLQQWDPLGSMEENKQILKAIFHIRWNDFSNPSIHDKQALSDLQLSIIQNQLLPRIQQVLESSRWDPCRQTEDVLDMYEYLQSLIEAQSSKSTLTDEEENQSDDQVLSNDYADIDQAEISTAVDLSQVVRKCLVLDTIYPKLQATLNHWKPCLDERNRMGLGQRLDLWILPWMPHLDHPAILPNLLSDCKRKLKSTLSYLRRKVAKGDDIEFARAATDLLKPWTRVYDPKSLQRMSSEYITPYLARALAKLKIRSNATHQSWTSVRLTFEMHALGLLSSLEFLSVIEAELLPRWAGKINEMMEDKHISVFQAAENYCLWKSEILVNPNSKSVSVKPSVQLLLQDDRICRIFYTVLQMIKSVNQAKMEELENLYPLSTNYHVVSARRTKEMRHDLQDEFVRMESHSNSEIEARIRLRRRQVDTPSFRDVIEELASERGILFQPRLGAKALKDGKQVFLFGDIPIYIEGDVIFASQEASTWRPTSLDKLLVSAGERE